jgi:hypothetical protein
MHGGAGVTVISVARFIFFLSLFCVRFCYFLHKWEVTADGSLGEERNHVYLKQQRETFAADVDPRGSSRSTLFANSLRTACLRRPRASCQLQ